MTSPGKTTWLPAALLAAVALIACDEKKEPPRTAGEHAGHGHAAGADEHGHGQEPSDLDRPVAELFAARCEHGMAAHACDTCRYEVGVVRAPERLFAGGLLRRVKAARRKVAQPLALTGEVQFDERRVAHVSTPTPGIIRRVKVTLGDKVRRGQPLIEIDSAEVGEARAAALEARGLLSLARKNQARLGALRKEGIASEKELLQADQQLNAAQIRSDAAGARLARLGMTPGAGGQAARGRLVLRAPSAGTVLEMHAVPGENAKSEQALLTVGDSSALWVWADLYERDFARVTRAQSKQPLAAAVAVKAFPGQWVRGTVDFISPSLSKPSRTVKLRITVPNPQGRLLSGMFARVNIFIPGEERALTVPEDAVVADEGRAFVFVRHEGDYYVRRPVTVGRTFSGWAEVRKGLRGDETIVSHGAFLLKSDVLRSKMGAGCAD